MSRRRASARGTRRSGRGHRVRWGGALLAALALGACAPPEPERRLAVAVEGCRELAPGLRCEVEPGRALKVWVEAVPAALRDPDDRFLGPPRAVGAGALVEVAPEEAEREVVIRAETGGGEAAARLRLEPWEPGPWWPAALAAARGEREGDPIAILEEALAGEPGPCERGPALWLMARLEHRADRPERSEALLWRALEAHRSCGRSALLAQDAAMLAHLLVERRAFAEARGVLAGVEPVPEDTGARFQLAYERALLERREGNPRAAWRAADEAARHARRSGRSDWWLAQAELRSGLLQEVGRPDRALELLEELRPDAEHLVPGDRVRFLNNLGWARLRALEAGREAASPVPLLEEVGRLLPQIGGAVPPDLPVNLELNLALARLPDAPEAARAHLDEGRRLLAALGEASLRLELWALDAEARLLARRGRWDESLEANRRLAEAAREVDLEMEWRGLVGAARSLEALGRRGEAVERYLAAEELVERGLDRVPIQAGRESSSAWREPATRRLLALLVGDGRSEEALRVARLSRTRVARSLEGRAEAAPASRRERFERGLEQYRRGRSELERRTSRALRELPGDRLARELARLAVHREDLRRLADDLVDLVDDRPGRRDLPSLDPSELTLVLHPLPAEWLVLAAHGGEVAAARVAGDPVAGGEASGGEDGARFLEPFADTLAAVDRVRILAHASLAPIDLHAARLGGQPLLATAEVVWGLDLGPRNAGGVEAGRSGAAGALVVGDPRGDLPQARVEARVAADRLDRLLGRPARRLLGEAATGRAVRAALSTAEHFHYAGHAVHAGGFGWEGALPLARRSLLTVEDVLTLGAVPRTVVLSGCETGGGAASGAARAAESMSLANAFLLAGAGEAVAALRPVADDEARALVAELYRRWPGRGSLAAPLAEAQLELRRTAPESDWASFRVVTR